MGPRPPDLISMPAVGISNNAMPDILNNNNNIYIYIYYEAQWPTPLGMLTVISAA